MQLRARPRVSDSAALLCLLRLPQVGPLPAGFLDYFEKR